MKDLKTKIIPNLSFFYSVLFLVKPQYIMQETDVLGNFLYPILFE